MRANLLVAASAAALGLFAFTPAMAAPAAGGYIDAGYANTSCSGCGHWDDWNVSGAAETPLGSSNFSVQGDGSYHSMNIEHLPQAHFSQMNLSVMYNASMGKVGATIGRDEMGIGPESISGTTYGAFGVLYPNQQWTLGVKGGAWEVGSGFPHVGYWGAEVKGYVQPNISLGLTYDQANFSGGMGSDDVTTWGGAAEWQPTASPWSVKLGYANTKFFGTNMNTWMLNFRWHFGGGSTLVDHDRNGAEPWGTQQTALRFLD